MGVSLWDWPVSHNTLIAFYHEGNQVIIGVAFLIKVQAA